MTAAVITKPRLSKVNLPPPVTLVALAWDDSKPNYPVLHSG